ncbi:hypothetical protein ACFPC0_10990 [Streptomyces andamanensis]|uniref:Head-to-tail adaptor n=1 Tax=Streptomyces andamanensis TaxID=1565035 RepID=A0ABV8TCP7_9ACTN
MPVINPTTPGPLHPDGSGPCAWPLDTTCAPGFPADPAEWTPQHVLAVEIATDLLWARTAGRFGLCPELIRPCRRACSPDRHGTGWLWDPRQGALNPYQDGRGRWFNFGCGCSRMDCSCKPPCSLRLPGPVNAVVEVRVDGQVLDPAEYRLIQRSGYADLLRKGGEAGECWPTCQDLEKDFTEPGTFSVLYLRGRAVPAAGMRALGSLAGEIYKQCTGAKGCRLPERVQTVTREGVTYDMFDPGEWLEKGFTGLRDVDTWIATVNPNSLRQPSAVFSLDLDPAPWGQRGVQQ